MLNLVLYHFMVKGRLSVHKSKLVVNDFIDREFYYVTVIWMFARRPLVNKVYNISKDIVSSLHKT